jgi:hypothetical protein
MKEMNFKRNTRVNNSNKHQTCRERGKVQIKSYHGGLQVTEARFDFSVKPGQKRKWYTFQLIEMKKKLKSLPKHPGIKSNIEIDVTCPKTRSNRPFKSPIESVNPEIWPCSAPSSGSV